MRWSSEASAAKSSPPCAIARSKAARYAARRGDVWRGWWWCCAWWRSWRSWRYCWCWERVGVRGEDVGGGPASRHWDWDAPRASRGGDVRGVSSGGPSMAAAAWRRMGVLPRRGVAMGVGPRLALRKSCRSWSGSMNASSSARARSSSMGPPRDLKGLQRTIFLAAVAPPLGGVCGVRCSSPGARQPAGSPPPSPPLSDAKSSPRPPGWR
mmetsp:Transcript_5726/g.16709  ORF Transcript_5726/g.16709 Transcript_5726/m.16709 type:complete len:210 (+) Transcript_5726:2528-3157(+)